MAIRDNHPSGSVISIGGELRIMPLRGNSREPETITLTAAATQQDATEIVVTSPRAVLIDNKFSVQFGGVSVKTSDYSWVTPVITVAAAALANAERISLKAVAPIVLPKGCELMIGGTKVVLAEEASVGVAGKLFKCLALEGAVAADAASVSKLKTMPVAGAIAAGASNVFLPTLSLRGLKSANQPSEVNTISIRTMDSGLGDEKRTTMVGSSLKLEGIYNQRDRAYLAVLEPASTTGTEIWAEYYSAVGTFIKGPALASGLSISEATDAVVTYTVDLGFQGVPEKGAY